MSVLRLAAAVLLGLVLASLPFAHYRFGESGHLHALHPEGAGAHVHLAAKGE